MVKAIPLHMLYYLYSGASFVLLDYPPVFSFQNSSSWYRNVVIQESVSHRKFPHKKVVVIGVGPAGLTAAYELCKANVNVCAIEHGQMVGGLSKLSSTRDTILILVATAFIQR